MDNTYREKKSKISVRALCSVAMLSAIAFVLMYIEVPAILMPSFIKLDEKPKDSSKATKQDY